MCDPLRPFDTLPSLATQDALLQSSGCLWGLQVELMSGKRSGKDKKQQVVRRRSDGKSKAAESRREDHAPDVVDAMWRVKSDSYPTVKSSDYVMLQRSVGNKTLRRWVGDKPIQRHSIPEGRQGVGEEEDEIQARREDRTVQRHSIPEGRQGVGEEEDEIQAKRDRAGAFGRTQAVQQAMIWGNGSGVLQRNKGKKAPPDAKGVAKGGKGAKKVKVDTPAEKQARKDHAKFTAGGPYTVNNFEPDNQENYGKFDVVYNPSAKKLNINMRIKFLFPDVKMPKGNTFQDVIDRTMLHIKKAQYINNFLSQVHAGWSGKFTFRNIREPQSIWGKLNPINVKVNVKPVTTNQHYILKGYFKKAGRSNVSGNKFKKDPSTATFFKDALDSSKQPNTGSKLMGQHEVLRLKRNLPKIRFGNTATAIPAKYVPDLQYVSDYLKRMNRPKFTLQVIGHANKTGIEKNNLKYSKIRAQTVADKLKAFGVSNHTIKTSGVGSAGASPDGKWRKVDIVPSIDPAFTNVQDTTLHEFGHMLGLDDEYVRKGDTRTHTMLHKQKEMQKMLGNKAYGKDAAGKSQENKYADEVSKVDPLTSVSVMERGNEIRMYHYVTLWQGLYNAAQSAKNQPAPPFSWKDWKVNA